MGTIHYSGSLDKCGMVTQVWYAYSTFACLLFVWFSFKKNKVLDEALCTSLWDGGWVIPKEVKFFFAPVLDITNTQSICHCALCAVKMSFSHLLHHEFTGKVQNFFGQTCGLQGCKPHSMILWLAERQSLSALDEILLGA